MSSIRLYIISRFRPSRVSFVAQYGFGCFVYWGEGGGGVCAASRALLRSCKLCFIRSVFPSVVCHRLVGLVVKASASRAEGSGFESRLRRDFFGVESYQ